MGRSPFRRPGPSGDDNPRRIANQTYPSEWNQYGMSMPRSKRNRSLAPVRDPDASPDIAHLLVMHHGIVDLDAKPEHLGGEAPYGGEQGIRRHDTIALRRHQGNPRIDQGLLGIEHVEGGTLADAGFFAHAIERNFR